MRTTLRSLLLAGLLAVATTAAAQPARTYTVKAGDTLYRVAVQHGLTVDELRRLNGLTGDVIRVGQRLAISRVDRIPVAKPALIVAETDSTTGRPFGRYAVQRGDSMFELAFRLGLHPDSLRAMNPAAGAVLEPGSRLRVPVVYAMKRIQVKSGETLFSIARDHGTTVQALMSTNGLTTDRISTGQALRVPSDLPVPEPGSGMPSPVETGRAAVFPERYSGRLMAGGQPYDPDRFFAAHQSLPLGAVLLLTAGDRSTFVEVSDRMPEGTDHLIEISSAAASALEYSGTPLTVRVIDVPRQ